MARAAATRDLGPFVAGSGAARRLPLVAGLSGAGGVGVAVGALGWALGNTPLMVVGMTGVYTLVSALTVLAVGPIEAWLFEGGVVHRARRRSTAVAWADLRAVQVWQTGRTGRRLCTVLVTAGGRRLALDVEPSGRTDTFGARLRDAARAAGRPVIDLRPLSLPRPR